MEYQAHPAASLFPMMSPSELTELASDIRSHGLLEAITLFEGMILDGRNRYAACIQADVKPRFETIENQESPTLYVLSKNLHRRHLSTSQRAAVAAECVPLLQVEARQRSNSNLRFIPKPDDDAVRRSRFGSSAKIAAVQTGVGERTVTRAVKIMREDPETFEKIKAGEITVEAGHRQVMGYGTDRLRPSRKDVIPPNNRKLGTFSKNRIIGCLSQIRGLCHGTKSFRIECFTEEEKSEWRSIALQASRELRALAARLQ